MRTTLQLHYTMRGSSRGPPSRPWFPSFFLSFRSVPEPPRNNVDCSGGLRAAIVAITPGAFDVNGARPRGRRGGGGGLLIAYACSLHSPKQRGGRPVSFSRPLELACVPTIAPPPSLAPHTRAVRPSRRTARTPAGKRVRAAAAAAAAAGPWEEPVAGAADANPPPASPVDVSAASAVIPASALLLHAPLPLSGPPATFRRSAFRILTAPALHPPHMA